MAYFVGWTEFSNEKNLHNFAKNTVFSGSIFRQSEPCKPAFFGQADAL